MTVWFGRKSQYSGCIVTGAVRLEVGIVLQVGWVVLQEKRCAVGLLYCNTPIVEWLEGWGCVTIHCIVL